MTKIFIMTDGTRFPKNKEAITSPWTMIILLSKYVLRIIMELIIICPKHMPGIMQNSIMKLAKPPNMLAAIDIDEIRHARVKVVLGPNFCATIPNKGAIMYSATTNISPHKDIIFTDVL